MIDVTMPQLGESAETGTIARWMKKSGDVVAVDEPMFEVSSDKVTMEIPSLVAGTLGEILVREGEAVPVGAVVARIATADERVAVGAGLPGRAKAAAAPSDRPRLSPVVRRLAREHQIDLSRVHGSAAGGRITKNDVLAFLASVPTAPAAPASPRPAAPPVVHATNGRAAAAPPPPRPVSTAGGTTTPLSPLRRTIVQHLTAAQKSAVNVFSVIEIDMEAVARERKKRGFTYLPFVARAVVEALLQFPALNASLDETASAITTFDAVHLGIAVDLEQRGLVVPVVRDAQRLNVAGLAAEIERVAAAARAGTLPAEAYAGSTFTITNNGAFGTLMTAPVINAPNVAILSTDAVEERPVAIDGLVGVRRRMYGCMTWDHRAFDGSTAARFLGRLKSNLQSWDWGVQ